jgi:hypothetical protein
LALTGLLACVPTAEAQRRWTFFAADVGVSTQALDNQFRDTFGPSLVGGFRTGTMYRPPDERRIGWEIAADFTLFQYVPAEDADVFRLRLLGGARLETPFRGDVRIVYRLLAGIDYIVASVPTVVVGTVTKEESGSLGPVLEPAVGALWQTGKLLVGVTAALPISYHYDGDAADRSADFDYLGVELELLLNVGVSL